VSAAFSGGITTSDLWVSNGATFNTTAKVNSVTESTSKTTGALIVSGGLGVSGNIYGGGDLFATLTATFGQRAHFSTGLTTSQLFVSGGATFNSRANFAAGLTTANLFVSTGATFGSRASFSSGLTAANLYVASGATFDSTATFSASSNAIKLTSATSQIQASNSAGYLGIFSTGSGFLVAGTPRIILQDADTDISGIPNISILPSGDPPNTLTLGSVSTTTTLNGTVAGATFTGRQTFTGGITAANLWVSMGATFGSRASFSSGLTTANLFVSGGATFGAAVSITGALVATGATFIYNMSLGTDKNLLKDATFKDFGEVFGYQIRKEIKDVKTSNRYYVDLSRGNTFYLDLYGSDNSGILGGFAPGDILPSIKVPSTAWATVTTTVGLTGATASTTNQGGTIAAGQFMFGPGITSTGCTAVSYNLGTGVIVLSKAAQATVSDAYTAFVRNNGEGYGMGASPILSTPSTLAPARVHSFTLIVGATASASITWQTGATHYGQIKWPSGTAPTLTTTSGKFDVFSFLSYDYGTSWIAFNAGQNF